MSRTIPCVADHFGTRVLVELTNAQMYGADQWSDDRVEVVIDNPESGEVQVTDVRLADLSRIREEE